jgi:hypothetical protein
MRRFIIVSLLILTPILAFAQTETESESVFEEYPSALGFAAGDLSGTGISYRHWFDIKTGFQITGGVLYRADEFSGSTLDYTLGAELLRSMFAAEYAGWLHSQLYIFGALLHGGLFKSGNSFTPGIGAGAGIGAELGLFRHFTMNLELAYGAFWRDINRPILDELEVNLIPQISLMYRY